jgi:chromosome segregation protein
VVGGAKDESTTHHLRMKAEIRELTQEVTSLEAQLQSAVSQQGELRAHIAERQAEIDAARARAHDAEIEILGAERDLREAEGELRRIAERTEEIARLTSDAREALAAIDADEVEARRELQNARQLTNEAAESVRAAETVLAERRRVVDEQNARVTEVKVRATQARERADRERSVLLQLERSAAEIEAREERLRGDVASAHRDQGQAAGRILLHQGRLEETAHEAAQARDQLAGLRGKLDDAQSVLGASEAALKALRGSVDQQSSELSELTLRERELTLAMEHLEEQIENRYRMELRTVIGDYHARPIPDAAVRDRAAELQGLIDRMGEINLTAIEEYEENAQRYEYLQGQRSDLQEALSKLERAIKQMNKESRTLFREAFAGINERFKRIFPILFRGGKAELRLTDPQDMLETGVEIIAQPPGKRLGSLELMSGGEKALTAVALIFAVFQYKPSPFCLLDEVDAPLDEANIGRFAEAIQQMTDRSQFIVITHSKRTMEYADVLYGVTMEQPGVSKLVSVELRGGKRPVEEKAPSVEAAE